MNGIVFDAGGLIALERNDRRIFTIVDTAVHVGGRILVPATALAQVVAVFRGWNEFRHNAPHGLSR